MDSLLLTDKKNLFFYICFI